MVSGGSLPPVDYRGDNIINIKVASKEVALVDLLVEVGVEALNQVSGCVSLGHAFEKEVGRVEAHSVHETQDLFGGFQLIESLRLVEKGR